MLLLFLINKIKNLCQFSEKNIILSALQIIFKTEILPKFHYSSVRGMGGWKKLICKTLIFENF